MNVSSCKIKCIEKAYLKDPETTKGLNICLMGEMDALPLPTHPDELTLAAAAADLSLVNQLHLILGV